MQYLHQSNLNNNHDFLIIQLEFALKLGANM